ncbi:MAG: ZIP family metal transporter [Crocinitomicaceae bacterium]|mgnify:FL=1|jgi:ZIP family zinc transporter|tara:strand:- start:627 stop:1481 length:855 start_codon:yes stop_codon:yes gene_type:complete
MDPVIGYSSWYGSMVDYLASIDPVLAALYATLFTWFLTAAGAGLVFFFKTLHRGVLDAMLGFTGGVMVAASFWSLLAPSIEMSESMYPSMKWMPAAVGFLVGALFLFGLDKILPHLHINFREEEKEGVKTEWHKTTLLVLAITLHNIPEGLAVGVVFGAAGMGIDGVTTAAAVSLAIGIGIQNFPEGFAVAMPLRRQGVSRRKSFWYGQMSAIVEPIFGVIGAMAVIYMEPILPYALAFAAGAMIYVVVEEVIPETQRDKFTDVAVLGFIGGFLVMMILDVSLG